MIVDVTKTVPGVAAKETDSLERAEALGYTSGVYARGAYASNPYIAGNDHWNAFVAGYRDGYNS